MYILSAEKKESPLYFINLNGLRTVAFLIVFLQHTFSEWIQSISIQNGWSGKIIRLVFQSGDLGVSAFFVLSGFLITHLLLHEYESTGQIKIWNFYMRRLLRIWPLYFAVLIYGFSLYPLIKEVMRLMVTSKNNFVYYFSFLSNFDVIKNERTLTNDPQISVTWSIAVEEQFYLIWPILFNLFSKAHWKWIFIVIIIACQIFRVVNRNDTVVLYFHSLSVIADLAMGGLAAYYAFYSVTFIRVFTNLNKYFIIGIYLFGVAWLLLGNALFPQPAYQVSARIVNTAYFTFIILEQCYCKQSFYKFSNFNFLSLWGKYTFGLYLLHMIVLRFVETIIRKAVNLPAHTLHTNFSYNVVQTILTLIISMFLSYLSYEYFERLFLRYKHRFNSV